jgi:hypothetical protein
MIRFKYWKSKQMIVMSTLLFVFQSGTAWSDAASAPDRRVYTGDRLKLITEIESSYAYSDLKHSDSLSGGILDCLLAASWKMKEDQFFILKYDGGYEKKLDFYSDGNVPRQRTEYQEHTLTPMLRMGIGHDHDMSVIPSLFYTATLNKDTQSTGWNDGLYNYYDAGAGIDFEFGKAGFGGGNGLLTVGLQYYNRHYPNFISLLDLAAENEDLGLFSALDTEKDEKDYKGILAKIEYLWASETRFSWNTEYSILYKKLDDKKVVDVNGSLTGNDQVDHLHTLSFQFTYNLTRKLQTGLKLGTDINKSNQNFWDGMESYRYEDAVATEKYYDYFSYGVQPEISYHFHPFPLSVNIFYSFHRTRYDHRKANFYGGAYKNEKQRELKKTIFSEISYRFSEKWSIHANWENTRSESNNDDERFYLYDYTLNIYSAGLSFKY